MAETVAGATAPTPGPAAVVTLAPGNIPANIPSQDIYAAIQAHDKANLARDNAEPGESPVQKDPDAPETNPEEKSLGYFSKWDKKLRTQEGKLKATEAELSTRMKSLEQAQAKLDSFEKAAQAAKQNPLAALEALGITYDDIVAAKLEGRLEPTEKKTDVTIRPEEIERLVDQKLKTTAEKQRQEADTQTSAELAQEVDSFIKDKAADFENVAAQDGEQARDAIIETMKYYWKTSKKVITVEEAAGHVEDALVEQALKASKTKRFQAKATPQPQGDVGETRKQTSPTVPASRLSNSLSTRVPVDVSHLPAQDRRTAIQKQIEAYDREQARSRAR